uniref:Helicase ATP-binding domain-containing protein n=1 Tax=Oryza meridionalis TaxID=40149 RepID=A0A0E0EAJ8_9ORYZ
MAAAGRDPLATPSSRMYYRRQRKASSEVNANVFVPGGQNGISFPASNRAHDWGYDGVHEEWEASYARKLQLINFLSSLHQRTANSLITTRMDANMDTPLEQKQKDSSAIIVLDSDDEDEAERCEQLASENNKQQAPSGPTSPCTTWIVSSAKDQVNGTLHVDGVQSTQIVPYGQNAPLINQSPLQTSWQPSIQYERVILQRRPEEQRVQDLVAASHAEKIAETQVFLTLPTLPNERKRRKSEPTTLVDGDGETNLGKGKRKNHQNQAAVDSILDLQQNVVPLQQNDVPSQSYRTMIEEEKPVKESDGLEDLWKDFSLAAECTKLDTNEDMSNEKDVDDENEMDDDCNHDIRIHEDLGHVCRICGMIVRKAETIIDYQWKKASRTRTNYYESRSKDADDIDTGAVKVSEDFIVSDIAIHPRHAKQMRPHQLEGFSFLVKNLVGDKPGGCILAHAPGSGKTFMLISFIQSFLAKYPSARPLVVLPKGILGTWKREFQRWQVEDIPLYDFYSVKADKRTEQLEVLKSWEARMSILFLGYKQFSRIICGDGDGNIAAACRDRLLMVPNLLILDEGHTPRNRETDVLASLKRVQTPRKVVLSGTLFQNHVSEVFNILDLVRPKFLKMESSRPIARRIMSQVAISGIRSLKGVHDSAFTESVEDTLLNDDNFTRKAHVIRSLRELTKDVLHYYKGDILDELPGLVDFSVFLKLSTKQKEIVHKIEAYEKFKRSAVGTALYIHPCLSEISEGDAADRATNLTDATVDSLIESIIIKDGVKAKFFFNILSLANSAGEKLLAFSQYILPMKFLERLLVKRLGWHVGKEIFMISGDTSADDREVAMDQFNNSADAKVLFGSIKACGEGISLVGASRVIILDVHLNPSVTRQAIGRAFRPGQQKKVFVYRLVAADSPEVKFHETAFKKEVIPKLWFEWRKEIFMISGDTSADDREVAMDQFNNSADAKVLFGSIKACGEGISLVGASRVIILDVHLNPSVTRQAIGRAFRPGQQKKVFVYRLVAADSPEVKFHETAFKKEVIPKLWFEWSELCTTEDFKLNQVDIDDSEDELLEANAIHQDIKALYRRVWQ